jgi:formylglycine-generating enzyme required for sulfatase activity
MNSKLEKPLTLVLCMLLAVFGSCSTKPSDVGRDAAVELEEYTNSVGMRFKLIPAGDFWMGSPDDEEGHRLDEGLHRVRFARTYYLGITEVTQGQWEAVMGTRPWEGEEDVKSGSDYAVSYVSWNDAVKFCEKLSEKEGREYRLPTEAQWEYACRAGTTTAFNFGDDGSDLGSYAWYFENTRGEDYPHAVGVKLPNAWGLYDMHGNVEEWCQDLYDGGYYGESPMYEPTGPSTKIHGWTRVARGGCWMSEGVYCRSAERDDTEPHVPLPMYGFRVTLDPPK